MIFKFFNRSIFKAGKKDSSKSIKKLSLKKMEEELKNYNSKSEDKAKNYKY